MGQGCAPLPPGRVGAHNKQVKSWGCSVECIAIKAAH